MLYDNKQATNKHASWNEKSLDHNNNMLYGDGEIELNSIPSFSAWPKTHCMGLDKDI